MSKTFRVSSKLVRPGGGWHETDGFVITYCPDDTLDQVTISQTIKTGPYEPGYSKPYEKISMTLEEAEWFVQFIRQSRENYKLWQANNDDPFNAKTTDEDVK